jgi:hypothetical protein
VSNENAAQVDDLLRQGIIAAKSGDKAKARELFERVVELDEENERGWFWLASVVDTDEERRLYLGNVVIINPNNTRAQELLDRIEGRASEGTTLREGEVMTGISRRTAIIGGIIGVGAIIAIIAVVLLLGGDGDDGDTVALASNTPTQTLTLTPSLSPTPSDTPIPSETPIPSATNTPTPTETPLPTDIPVLTAPLQDVPGRILMLAGDGSFESYGGIALFSPSTNSQRVVLSGSSSDREQGRHPSMAPDNQRFVFVRRLTNSEVLQITNINWEPPPRDPEAEDQSQFQEDGRFQDVADYWDFEIDVLDDADMPSWSPAAELIAFVAEREAPEGGDSLDLFIVDVRGQPEARADALAQLTADDADDYWPAWSPDGSQIVYVADVPASGDVPRHSELRVIDIATREIRTLDVIGLANPDSAPDWEPNGERIIFVGQEANSPYPDIWIIEADGGTLPLPLLNVFIGDEIKQPRWSPDGQWIVFSANSDQRPGTFNTYIYELETERLVRLSEDLSDFEIANDWIE